MTALSLGLIAALSWGIHDVTIRKISQTAPLMATLLGVLLTGAVFQIGVMLVTDGFTALPSQAIYLSIAAGVAFLIASTSLYGAFHRGPVRIVAPVIGSYPILSVGWAALGGATVTLFQWLAVFAVVAGIAIVSVFSDDTETQYPPKLPTILLSIAAAFGFFSTFALGHEAARIADDLPSILITRVTSILLLLPVFPILSLPFWPGRSAVPFIAVMGILDGIALLCVLSAGSLPSPQYAAVASSVFGMVTVILAWALLRERLTSAQWIGCAVAFAGIGYLAL
ncbi:DMT family transporter [uncultured Roseobacter sp.]|uniref:DMT family transporter n=1 Tax=uncultured Roseobacter sp. TaxID=114847 RepID=UPI0026248599|nr:DMT family transporter [uncultured Roseobacter sp.]